MIDRWAHLPSWDQMLIRALIYRIATWPAARWTAPPDDAYRPVVDLVLEYAGSLIGRTPRDDSPNHADDLKAGRCSSGRAEE